MQGFDIAAGAEGARLLLDRGERPTAIFAITDLMAIGAMCAIQKAGLRIPEDMAVTGFNDISLAALVNPPLTTAQRAFLPDGSGSDEDAAKPDGREASGSQAHRPAHLPGDPAKLRPA